MSYRTHIPTFCLHSRVTLRHAMLLSALLRDFVSFDDDNHLLANSLFIFIPALALPNYYIATSNQPKQKQQKNCYAVAAACSSGTWEEKVGQ